MSEYYRKPIVKILMLKGQEGQSIKGIKKTGTDGLVDTYTITLTDGTTSTFTVTNGKGISSLEKTETSGLVDTYTIEFNDGTTSTFTVTNGDSAYKPAVEALGKRIDNLILSSGTESSAEVVDARNGYDGTTYDTLGTAIRSQVSELKGDLTHKIDNPTMSDNDKIPRAKDGSVEWVEIGLPTDEQTNSAVTSWLNKHPEATTTVQDGSIEEIKINKNFLPWIKKDYVTPEMFGAVGDGVTDDTKAFQSAFDTGINLIVCSHKKTYNLPSAIIKIKNLNQTLDLNGSSIIDATFAYNMNDELTDWENAYSHYSFTCKNGEIGTYNKTRNGQKEVVFLTGGYLKLQNLIVKRTPHLVAHAQRFIDHFLMEDVMNNFYREEKEDYKNLDYINVINRSNGNIERVSATVYSQGDCWLLKKVHGVCTTLDNDYRFMRIAFHNPIKFDMCIQIPFEAIIGANVICDGCHYEAKNSAPSYTFGAYGTSITFNNCAFVKNYEIIDTNSVHYNNCVFNVGINSPSKWSDYFKKPIEEYSCQFNQCSDYNEFLIDSESIKRKLNTGIIKDRMDPYYLEQMKDIVFYEQDNQYRSGGLPNGTYSVTTFIYTDNNLNKCFKKMVTNVTKTDENMLLISNFGDLLGGGYLCIFYITFPDGSIKRGWIKIDNLFFGNIISNRFVIWDGAIGLYNGEPGKEQYWNTLVDVEEIPNIEVIGELKRALEN